MSQVDLVRPGGGELGLDGGGMTDREPPHVVSARLGHASPVITMTVYAHVLPGSQREAADRFARLVGEAQ